MDAQDIDYYKAAVGENWDSHYCTAFKRISAGSVFNWNWSGFFVFVAWSIYRKMYAVGFFSFILFLSMGLSLIGSISNNQSNNYIAVISIVLTVFSGGISDFLYYKKISSHINGIKLIEPDHDRVRAIVALTPSTHKWIPKFCIGIFILGVALAVILPAISDHQKKEAKVSSIPPEGIPLDKVDWSQFGKPIPPQESIKAQQDAEHKNKILAAHPDAGQIAGSKDFERWSNSTPQYKQIADAGSAEQVIWLLSTYKQKLTDESRERDRKTQEAQLQNTARKAENAQEQLNAYVRRVYPDFSEIVASPTFSNWLYYNPHNQRTAQEVVDMIRDYKRDMAQQAASQ